MMLINNSWVWLEKGGTIMVPLLFCSIVGLAIVLTKLFQLRHNRIIIPEIVRLIRSITTHDDAEHVLRVCRQKGGPFANVIQVGLENREMSPDGLREMLEEQGRIDIDKFQWENFYTKGRTKPPYVPDGMTADELEEYAHLAYRLFYLRPQIMLNMLRDLRITSFKHFTQVVWNLARLNLSYFI